MGKGREKEVSVNVVEAVEERKRERERKRECGWPEIFASTQHVLAAIRLWQQPLLARQLRRNPPLPRARARSQPVQPYISSACRREIDLARNS
jgi:hypothetical protein